MADDNQQKSNEQLTQKDIVQLLLHNAQHMVTREELKSDINEVKDEIVKVEVSIRQDVSKIETSLKEDISKVDDRISKVEVSLKQDISKVNAKFDKIQWLFIATIITVLLKDYLFSFF
ncbi:MAG: hypothetical protein JJV99_04235 [Colwellia sp.]|nr:hypothetical protein [Colwellia sp.]